MDQRHKRATVGALVLLTCLVQVWTIARAVAPAQDCVRYLIVAQGIERAGLVATLREQPEQPLFSAIAWAMHRLLSASGWLGSGGWAICLQAAAAVALVLSVIPVYALFCLLHGERAALIGALLYCLLGGISRLGADGLSDSTHLALFCLALWAAARYFSVQRPDGRLDASCRWLLLCGMATAAALMARVEAVILPVAVLATLALLQMFGRWRQSWWAVARASAALSLGLAAVMVPYFALCDAGSASTAMVRLTGRRGASEAAPLNDFDSTVHATAIEPRWDLPGVGRLVFGKKETSTSGRFRGYLAAGAKLMQELAQTLHYWLGALALLGLWSARRQPAAPLDRFMQCLCATLVAAAIGVAAEAGYLSTRHVLLLVVVGLGWAGVGTLAVADYFSGWRLAQSLAGARSGAISSGVACLAVAACALDCAAPLHASRGAHREAARWLSEHASPSDAVLDSRGWTALYTGRKTYRYEAAQAAFTDPALAYVVVEQAELAAASRRSETMRMLLAQAGEPVARFAVAGADKHGVIIHRWLPERFQQLGVQSYAR